MKKILILLVTTLLLVGCEKNKQADLYIKELDYRDAFTTGEYQQLQSDTTCYRFVEDYDEGTLKIIDMGTKSTISYKLDSKEDMGLTWVNLSLVFLNIIILIVLFRD